MQMIVGMDGLGLPLIQPKPEELKKLEFHAVRQETKKMPRERRKSRYIRKQSQLYRLKSYKEAGASLPDFQGRVLMKQ